jgi:probable HAF family extracellular repeat protein
MSHSSLQARTRRLAAIALAIALPGLAACSGAASSFAPTLQSPASADAGTSSPDGSTSWNYSTLDNPDDPDFNELLGINNIGKVCGFDGEVGNHRKPARGYCSQDYGNSHFRNENYPGAVATVVTSLNSARTFAGWYLTRQGWIFGFIYTHGIWTSYKDPQLRKGSSNTTELLGINQSGLAVGFYSDERGIDHGFELNEVTGKFHGITPPGGRSVEATGINGKGDIVGWMTTAGGETKSFLLKGGSYTIFANSHGNTTEALAVNWQDQVVGFWSTNSGTKHAFVLTNPLNAPVWQTIKEPKADGTTVLTSIQDHDYMVGYYVDGAGHTNGFLATPAK